MPQANVFHPSLYGNENQRLLKWLTVKFLGTLYGFSDKGWMTGVFIFLSWFKKLFWRYAPASRPLLLFLDGHSSYYCPSTIELAEENGIIIFTLPPNTTHLLNLWTKVLWHWRQVGHDYIVSHPGQVVCTYNFSSLLSKAWIEAMTVKNILSGFETTGVYPVDRYAVQLPGESNTTDRPIIPCPRLTPFKRHPVNDGLYSSGDISPPTCSKRPNAVTNNSRYEDPDTQNTTSKSSRRQGID